MGRLVFQTLAQDVSTGALIGQPFNFDTLEEYTNRETLLVTANPPGETTFLFTPVTVGKASFLVIRNMGLEDPTTGDSNSALLWGYVTGPTYPHETAIGETSIVKIGTTSGVDTVYCASSVSNIWVEFQVWAR